MKEKYIDLMEKCLGAYTDEHILRYFTDVKTNGLTEHGFPRLTSNIGILIAHGRRTDLLPIFREMMAFCCKTIPRVKAANDFSVQEIVACIMEVERAKILPDEEIAVWKADLATIEPTACYTRFALSLTDDLRNWALFTGVSEYARLRAGIGGSMDFIEMQIATQLPWLDENGMYMDTKGTDVHQPILYDLVTRGLFACLLHAGYRGRYYDEIDACLRKAGLLTLAMQSSRGEMPFGGRSNQFLHNEPCGIIVMEYEASRYAKEGNLEMASKFKAAIARALAVTEYWLAKEPIRHIKNRFPTETKYGCEFYAYFDKYMITVASNLYTAYVLCDDTIPTGDMADSAPCVFQTTDHFHKIFLKSGGYALEFDTNAEPDEDANGLGRVHRAGAPASLCLSMPCSGAPFYTVDIETPFGCSLCAGVRENGEWKFAADGASTYEEINLTKDAVSASVSMQCRFADGQSVREQYTVSETGVQIEISGEGSVAYMLPAFAFDGETHSAISQDAHTLTVSYEGWICRYSTDGEITDLEKTAANRNGHYRVFAAFSEKNLRVQIEIVRAE